MKPTQINVGMTIKFKYCDVTVIGKVGSIVSGHCFCRLLRDYTSNAGKFHKAEDKQLFVMKNMEDIKLFDESIQ
jgi:hypothetical protein